MADTTSPFVDLLAEMKFMIFKSVSRHHLQFFQLEEQGLTGWKYRYGCRPIFETVLPCAVSGEAS
jgi:hypothetical protein